MIRKFSLFLCMMCLLLAACSPKNQPAIFQAVSVPQVVPQGFTAADGSRALVFPQDFGAHPDFRTEWWYYTGNLETEQGRHFGFELTFFRVGLQPPAFAFPQDSRWYGNSLYFAHLALSDVESGRFYAYERYSRPGPGLAGAQGDPYRVWLEDWSVSETAPGEYHLLAEQDGIRLDLSMKDEMGVVLHGDAGYSRKGRQVTNASYYYSQPRLEVQGGLFVDGVEHNVGGLAWKDHEFSTGVLDEGQIGWDWFSLQFEHGPALMLFQLRDSGGAQAGTASGTYIHADGIPQAIGNDGFDIRVLDVWRSPHSGGQYPAAWRIHLAKPDCLLELRPWMPDQEVNFPAVTYWEGAVRFEGTCANVAVRGNGYVELTGYAGNLPLP